MVFQPGNRANPGGRPKEKIFTDALRLAVNEEIELDGVRTKKIRRIAERLVAEAMAGESWAIQQVADRLDGKPAQDVDLNATHDVSDPLVELMRAINGKTRGLPDKAEGS